MNLTLAQVKQYSENGKIEYACVKQPGPSRARTGPGYNLRAGPLRYFSIGYLEVNKPNINNRIRIIFGNLFTYNL